MQHNLQQRLEFSFGESSHYRLMFGAYRTTTSQPPTDLVEDTDNAFMVLVNAIIRGQQAGVMRADDRRQLALVAWRWCMVWQCY